MAESSAHEAVTAAALRGDAGTLRAFAESLPPLEAYRYDRRLALAYAAALEGDADAARTHFALTGVAPLAQRNADAAQLEELLAAPVAVPPRPLLERAGVPAVTVASLIAAVVALALLPRLGSDEPLNLGLAAPPSSDQVVVIAKQPPRPQRSEPDAPPVLTPAVSQPAASIAASSRAPLRGRLASRPRTRRVPAPATPRPAPAAQPAPASEPEPTGVLAAAAAPAPTTAPAPAPQQQEPVAKGRGKAVGHAKPGATAKAPQPTQPPATAALPAPDPSPADVPAADHPSPPEHSNGNGRDGAPGQRKQP